MKKYITALIFFLAAIVTVQAQSGFVYTKNKNKHSGEEIQYVSKLFKAPYFRVDGEKFAAKNVLFYQIENDFFGRIRNSYNFARREEKGNINIFVHQEINYNNNFNYGYGMNNRMGRMGFDPYGMNAPQTSNKFYYNIKPLEPLKRLNYINLKEDLKSNRESMYQLKQYRKKRATEYGMYAIGGIATVLGFRQIFNKGVNGSNNSIINQGTGFVLSGLITIGIGTWVGKSRQEHLLNAVEIYND